MAAWSLLAMCATIPFVLMLEPWFEALLLLVVYRNYVVLRRQFAWARKAKLIVDKDGHLSVVNGSRMPLTARSHHLRGRYFYFAHLSLCFTRGKPLEILIFSRYDQRLNYQRLVRHLIQS